MSALVKCTVLLFFLGLAAGEIKNKGWWKNTVFYQVYPRSFKDSNGDGIGDLQGITDKLQHFKDSGIGAIWLSPIFTSPMIDFGYDISDFKDIDPAFGSMADLEIMTKKAKELGIKVVLDLVPNHSSDKHFWFQQSVKGIGKYKDYYMWHEGRSNNAEPPNNWISVFSGPAWTYNPDRKMWYFHQFDYRQPDLNYTNPNVRQEMEDVIKFWLSKGIDGFRIDAIPHVYERDDLPDEPLLISGTPQNYPDLDHIYTKDDPRTYELIKSWRTLMDKWSDEHNEDEKVILTEAYTALENTTKYYQYGSNVPFNFNFIMSIDNKSSPNDFKKNIEEWMNHMPKGEVANWVVGNHDRSRVASRYPGRADQMIMLTMLLPGIAVTYNGEEIAMEDKTDISWAETQDPQACNTDPEHYQSRSRDINRTPFQWDDTKNAGFSDADETWLPVHSNYKTLNLKKQMSETGSHYQLYKNLTWMRTTDTLRNGGLKIDILNDDKVLAVVREAAKHNVILLINFSDDQSQKVDVTAYAKGKSNVTISLASHGSEIVWGTMVEAKEIHLQAKASIIIEATGAAITMSLNVILSAVLLVIVKLI
ncbi:hypothetical protein QAD02_016280 [Eretmocerus hayati]|uniref:Uncharacterized protein n=1 Tax=Eretmocerus hayati TaxID=131215 RepID=A0ACC2PBM9_9HYME|nr:hypothetical protein QAD02_016280 [Eretmocerus hayati]